MSDLFTDAAAVHQSQTAPLPQRIRPRSLDELVGQRHVLADGSALRLAIEGDRPPSMILYGPPGVGKTTLARIVAETHRRRLRGALGRVGARRRRARRAPACPRPARGERGTHDPLPRRDPPLQQGPAGCPPPGRRERPADADRGDHREPVLRGQRGPPLPLRRRRARAALGRGGGSGRRSRCGRARDRGPGGRRRGDRAEGRRRCPQRALDAGALLADRRRRRCDARGAARRRRRPQAPAALRQGRRPALRHHLRVHQVDARRRPRRGRLLPRRDARGRRGRPLHRAPDGDPRLRGRRQRRSPRRWSSPSRQPRRSSTSGCPRRS